MLDYDENVLRGLNGKKIGVDGEINNEMERSEQLWVEQDNQLKVIPHYKVAIIREMNLTYFDGTIFRKNLGNTSRGANLPASEHCPMPDRDRANKIPDPL